MSDAAERAALRARLGAGARWDAEGAPAEDLLLARRGTAYFARLLNGLPDAALFGPSRVPGRSRAQVVAGVSYRARALCAVLAAMRAGAAVDTLRTEASDEALARGGTLPPRALRSLFRHTEVHLNVEWRDLAAAHWDVVVTDRAGRRLALRDSARLRARQIWQAAIQLDAGASRADVPAGLT